MARKLLFKNRYVLTVGWCLKFCALTPPLVRRCVNSKYKIYSGALLFITLHHNGKVSILLNFNL
jgi:hypothetical protein